MVVLFVAALFSALPLTGQTEIPVNVPTPEAASLGSYGNIPISCFSGRPSVSIPLHEFNVRGLVMPVTLVHDASGVNLNTLPSLVGYNWKLVTGGVITRQVHGNPDEIIYPQQANVNFQNYFDSYNMISSHSNPGASIVNIIDNPSMREYDLEPDVFTFSFMGHSGRFYLGNDGQWKVMSEDNLEVIYDVQHYRSDIIAPVIVKYPCSAASDRNQPKTIKGFKIRDEQGYTYEFGGDTTAIDYETDFMRQTQDEQVCSWIAISWYLTRVTDRFGQELYHLTYSRGRFTAQFYHAYEETLVTGQSSWSVFGTTHVVIPIHSDINFPFAAQLSAPTYLSRIDAADGTYVKLQTWSENQCAQYTSPGSALRRASASFGSVFAMLSRTVNSRATSTGNLFQYLQSPSYSNHQLHPYPYSDATGINLFGITETRQLSSIEIGESTTNTFSKINFLYTNTPRPFLSEVRFQGKYDGSGRVYKRYKMEYDHPELLPKDCLTDSVDHWGYYRGSSFTDLHSFFYRSSFANSRAPSASFMGYGTLKKMVYPTGGTTTFEYEPNDYSSHLSANRQSLVSESGTGGGLRIKRIQDFEDEACTHLIDSRSFSYNAPGTGNSSGVLTTYPSYYFLWNPQPLSGTLNAESFRNTSIIPLSNSFGPSVGYTWVTETRLDGSCVRHKFSNYPDIPFDLLEVTPTLNTIEATPFDKFGELSFERGKEILTLEIDSTGTLKRKAEKSYRTDINVNDYVLGAAIFEMQGYGTGNLTCYPGRLYRLFHQKYDLIGERVATYQGGDSSVVSTTYTRNDHSLTLTQPHTHRVDFRSLDSHTVNRGHAQQKCDYGYTFNSDDSALSGLFASTFLITPVRLTRYSDGIFESEKNLAFSSFNVNGQAQLLPCCETITYPDNTTDTLVTFNSYTGKGRPLRYTAKGNPPVVLYWTNNDCYLQSRGVGSMYTHYTNDYLWQKVKKITMPNGVFRQYEYDRNGMLSTVKLGSMQVLSTYEYNYKLKQ